MNRQEANALVAEGESPRWVEVGWIIPPRREYRPTNRRPRLAHRVIESRRTGAWTLRCNSVGVIFAGYRLVDTVVGWPKDRLCVACARIELSRREMRRENDTPRARVRARGIREDKRVQHRRRVMRHLTKKRAIKRAWLDPQEDDE